MRRPIAAMVILDVCTEDALRSAAHVCICLSCISCRACRAPTSGRGLGLVGVMGCSRNCQPKNPLQLLVGAWAWSARAYTINERQKGCRAKQWTVLVVVARLGPHSIRSSGNVTYSYREVDSGLLASPAKAKCTLLRPPAWLVGWCFSLPQPWQANPGKQCLLAHGKSPCG